MPRTCTVCSHPQRDAIDKALASGESFRGLSAKYRVSEDALGRHKEHHLPATLAQATQAQEVARADNLIDEMRNLQQITMGILSRAGMAGDHRVALQAVGEARRNLELLGKLLCLLDERPQINVLLSPEWIQVRTKVLYALSPYPEAREAVSKTLLLEVDSGRSE